MTVKELYNMLDQLKETDREEVLAECISDRLTKSLESYEDNIEQDTKYLAGRNTLNVLKKIGRKRK